MAFLIILQPSKFIWKILIFGMVRVDQKNYDGSNGEVYGGILIFLKTHVNHQRVLFTEDFVIDWQGLQLPF